MKTVLRPLVFLNVLAALVFILPLAVSFAAESVARGSLMFELAPARPIERDVEKIRAIKDIEKLRQRALMLEQTLDFERRIRQDDSLFTRSLGEGLGLLFMIAAAGFLANAAFLIWALRRQPARQ